MKTRWTLGARVFGYAAALAMLCSAGAATAVTLDRQVTIQGAVYTTGGTPADGVFDMDFVVYGASSGGTKLWNQAKSGVAVTAGLFDVTLGPIPDGLLEGNGALWLETVVEGTTLPRQPLRAVPYALVAQTANQSLDLQCSGCVGAADIADGVVGPTKLASGTYGINISGNAATATTASSAATAASFTGALGGDVTGTQSATTVGKIRGVNVVATVPANGQVLKYNAGQTRWEPATLAGVTSVGTGAGLTGGPITSTGTIDLRLNGAGGLSRTLGAGSNELGIGPAGVVPSMVASGTYGINVSGNAATATTASGFSGALSGDVVGTQGATSVAKIKGVPVAATVPAANEVLKYNAVTGQWGPASDTVGTGTVSSVGTGKGLSGGPITTTGTLDLRMNTAGGLSSGLGAGSNELGIAAGGVVPSMVSSGTFGISISGNAATATTATKAGSFTGALAGDVTGGQTATKVTKLQGVGVATTAPTNGQVLKYNSTSGTWAPGADANGLGGTVASVNTGAGLSGGPITTSGTIDVRLNTAGGLSKALGTGTNELGIAAGGVVPAMLASGTFGINISGSAASATTATSATTAGSFTGALGGDVTGTQAATKVAKLQGVAVATTAPANGQILKYNSTSGLWAPAADNAGAGGTVKTVNTGAGLVGGPITTTGTVDLRLNTAGGLSKALGTGTNELGIAAGGVVPAMVASGTYGINVSGNAATATSATSATTATTATTAGNFTGALGGDVTGTQAATKVGKLQGVVVATTVPTSGQVLKYNGTQWAPATDVSSGGTVKSVATGQGLVGGTITTTGTIDLRLNTTGGLSKTLGTGTNELGIGASGVVPAMVAAGTYGISISGNAATATTATTATQATSFTGALAGDVTGTQAATKVAKIQGYGVATAAPANNQVLKYSTTTGLWTPAADATGGTVSSVATGNGLMGGTITTTGTINLRMNAAGGLSNTLGTGANELGVKAAGIVPAMVAGGTYGISISGNAATATSATSATTATTSTNFTGALGGDVTGNQATTKVGKIQGYAVVTTAPASGQVLKYNGSAWAPAADATFTGVSTVTASAPLSSSGGAAPNITLSGTVPINRGGTGMTTSPTAAGQFLRATGSGAWGVSTLAAGDIPAGSGNYIQNGTGAQSANFNITGAATVGTLVANSTTTIVGSLRARGGLTNDLGTLSINGSNGVTNFGNYIQANGKYVVDATDSWLRLNQQNSFTNGIYSPYFFRVDGGIASGGVGSLGAGTINATGIIKIGDTTSACNSGLAGAMRWSGTKFEGCTGSAWVQLDNVGGGSGGTCTPSGARQAFNSLTQDSAGGCWNGNPCPRNDYAWDIAYGQAFIAVGQAITCGGSAACVAHVGITTFETTTACQGQWNVYCDGSLVGMISTINKTCTGSAMTNGCSIAFGARTCSSIKVEVATSAQSVGWACCGMSAPDSMITAVSAW